MSHHSPLELAWHVSGPTATTADSNSGRRKRFAFTNQPTAYFFVDVAWVCSTLLMISDHDRHQRLLAPLQQLRKLPQFSPMTKPSARSKQAKSGAAFVNGTK